MKMSSDLEKTSIGAVHRYLLFKADNSNFFDVDEMKIIENAIYRKFYFIQIEVCIFWNTK